MRRLGGRAAGCREKSHRAKPKEHPKKLGQRDRNFLHHFYNKTKIYEPLFAYTKAVLLFREKEREREIERDGEREPEKIFVGK